VFDEFHDAISHGLINSECFIHSDEELAQTSINCGGSDIPAVNFVYQLNFLDHYEPSRTFHFVQALEIWEARKVIFVGRTSVYRMIGERRSDDRLEWSRSRHLSSHCRQDMMERRGEEEVTQRGMLNDDTWLILHAAWIAGPGEITGKSLVSQNSKGICRLIWPQRQNNCG
jgi:hypothetical protein